MKTNGRFLLMLWLVMCFAGLAAGCAMLPKERISSSTTDYNLVVEKVQNEMLLLNIVRASKRHPMYFTGFNLLRGSISYSFQTGSITIPFGRIGAGLDGSYSIVPSVSYSTSPSFDLMVWDSKEFTTGIMTPISLDAVYYYVERLGWPKEMLLHLLVERIEMYRNDALLATYENYPGNREKLEGFQTKLRELMACRLVTLERNEPIGPRVQARDAVDLNQLIEIHKAGLKLDRVTEGGSEWYQLTSKKTDYSYRCGEEKGKEADTFRISDEKKRHLPGSGDKPDYRFLFRSPEGILYYLGEIIRAEAENGYVPMIEVCKLSPPVPLFVVNTGGGKERYPIVSVDYQGTTYSIPGSPAAGPGNSCAADRSMHVLTFVSQLIAEQKAGMNVPVTGAVTAVGR